MIKVIRHKAASLPQTDGSIVFTRLRPCALPWRHTGAIYRIWLKLCCLQPTRVHNPNCKSVGSATLHSSWHSVVRYARARHSSNNCPSLHRRSGPYLIRASLGLPKFTTQMASRSVQLFLHSSRQKVPILYNGRPFPPKRPRPLGDLDLHLIHGSVAHPSPRPKWHLDRFSHFCRAH